MKWCVPFLLLFILSIPLEGGAEEVIKKGEVHNLERCIEIALKMQPTIAAAAGTVNINESRVGQAKSTYYPQINWSASYDRVKSESGSSSDSVNGFLGRSDDAYDRYATGFTLRQLIYDFGKTATQ